MAKIAEYGSVVCHYTKGAVAFEHILAERRLRFSPYRLMRDPVESRKAVPNPQSFGNLEGPDAEMETVAEIHKAANALKSETKLLALTTDAPEYAEGGGCKRRCSVADGRGPACGSSTARTTGVLVSCSIETSSTPN